MAQATYAQLGNWEHVEELKSLWHDINGLANQDRAAIQYKQPGLNGVSRLEVR